MTRDRALELAQAALFEVARRNVGTTSEQQWHDAVDEIQRVRDESVKGVGIGWGRWMIGVLVKGRRS